MTRVAGALAAVSVLASALAGCATPSRSLDAVARVEDAAALERWSISGRVAVSNGKDGGSGRIEWVQRGAQYAITIRAPVSNQTWRLSNEHGVVRLEGVRPEPVEGDDAQELLAREAGWRLPIAEMQRWIRGVAYSSAAEIETDGEGLPKTLRESGWTVTYRNWDTASQPALPSRIAATRPPYKVRLAVSTWGVQ